MMAAREVQRLDTVAVGAGEDSMDGVEARLKPQRTVDSGIGGSDAGSSAGDDAEALITSEMLKAEARAVEANEEKAKQEEKKALDEYESLVEHQRLTRLHHLLDRSSLYTDFLHSRMKEQREEAQARAARDDQRQTKGKGKAKAKGKGKGQGKQKASKKRKVNEADYEITDYINEDDINKRRKTEDGEEAVDGEAAKILEYVVRGDGSEVPAEQPALLSGGVLRDYQMRGVNWLKALYENGLNGILADEMGLGKTIQCIGFFAHLYEMKVKGPYLVVGPLSTLTNWYREFQRFTPDIPVVLYHGNKTEREEMRRHIMEADEEHGAYKTVITSYQIVMNDRSFLAKLPWKYIVVDEGHRLKNLNCQLIRDLKQYRSANRLLLTGTPLQNDLSELWALLNFLLPDIFNDLESFQRWFDFTDIGAQSGNSRIIAEEQEKKVLSKLHKILQPFLLRRLKTDVAKTIPPKKELVVYAGMSALQQDFYKKIIDKTLLNELHNKETEAVVLADGAKRPSRAIKMNYTEDCLAVGQSEATVWVDEVQVEKANVDSVVNLTLANCMMHLRKACNHPYLINYPLAPDGQFLIDGQLVASCGKMMLLDRMLPELMRRGHKVLIFSQMVKMLDILQDYCWLRDIDFARLDGTISHKDRTVAIDRFQEEEGVQVMLISTRAGGLGVNLMAADTVIIYDSDWNPQSDLQAQDRCHRIGQTKPVMVYRYIVANTIDERILERAEAKRKLEKMVIHKRKFKGVTKNESYNLTKDDLQALLEQSGAEKVVMAGKVLDDEELERILDRSEKGNAQGSKFKVVEQLGESSLL